MIPTTEELVQEEAPIEQNNFKIGVVVELFENSTAKITFDGEESASEKQYAYLASYKPSIGDRVLLANVSGTYIIMGKILYNEEPSGGGNDLFRLEGNLIKTNYNMEVKGWMDILNEVSSGHTLIVNLKQKGKLGFFGNSPIGRRTCSTLSSGATLSTVINKVNEIIGDFKAYGLYG
jgi:hypothetical protein